MRPDMTRNNFWSDLALVTGICILYLNLPVNLMRFYHVPFLAAAALYVVFVVPFLWHVVIQRDGFVIDKWFVWMIVLFATMVASALFARDAAVALSTIGTFIGEGLCLYLLVVNGIRNFKSLRRAAWALRSSRWWCCGLGRSRSEWWPSDRGSGSASSARAVPGRPTSPARSREALAYARSMRTP